MNFGQWMATEGLSRSSIGKYDGAINGALSVWAADAGLFQKSLASIGTKSAFDAIASKIALLPIFIERNATGNHMYSSALVQFGNYLEAKENTQVEAITEQDREQVVKELEEEGAFDVANETDARRKMLKSIVVRQGQDKFREKVLDAYRRKCAVTGCSVESVLEAAHIKPYLGEQTHHVTNGLLLRADIHTLFDLGLMRIHPLSMTIEIAVSANHYAILSESVLYLPDDLNKHPNLEALSLHYQRSAANFSENFPKK